MFLLLVCRSPFSVGGAFSSFHLVHPLFEFHQFSGVVRHSVLHVMLSIDLVSPAILRLSSAVSLQRPPISLPRLVGLLFLQTDSPYELGIMDDFVQCRSNPRIKYFKIRH